MLKRRRHGEAKGSDPLACRRMCTHNADCFASSMHSSGTNSCIWHVTSNKLRTGFQPEAVMISASCLFRLADIPARAAATGTVTQELTSASATHTCCQHFCLKIELQRLRSHVQLDTNLHWTGFHDKRSLAFLRVSSCNMVCTHGHTAVASQQALPHERGWR